MPTSLRLTRVGKRYDGRGPFVLRQVSMTLDAGDLVHVTGINGCGKSTLLRVIAGVTAASRGSIHGRPASVGFVPERFPPAVQFTPRDYLRHLAGIRRTGAREGLELLDRLGGRAYVDTPMTELSKGSCQKVALAQGLMGPPGLLVLDEAWTGLDTAAQAVLTAQVQQCAEAGGIVVLTDHVRRAGAVRPTTRWLVADGEVTEVHGDAPLPLTVVVLTGSGPDLADRPGVLTSTRSATGVTVEVSSDSCDDVLAAALNGGWSVHEVRPAR